MGDAPFLIPTPEQIYEVLQAAQTILDYLAGQANRQKLDQSLSKIDELFAAFGTLAVYGWPFDVGEALTRALLAVRGLVATIRTTPELAGLAARPVAQYLSLLRTHGKDPAKLTYSYTMPGMVPGSSFTVTPVDPPFGFGPPIEETKSPQPSGAKPQPQRTKPATKTTTNQSDITSLEQSAPPLDTGSGLWVRNKLAARLEGLGTRTLADYRQDGIANPALTLGRDKDGRIWRREGTPGSHPWYLKSSLIAQNRR